MNPKNFLLALLLGAVLALLASVWLLFQKADEQAARVEMLAARIESLATRVTNLRVAAPAPVPTPTPVPAPLSPAPARVAPPPPVTALPAAPPAAEVPRVRAPLTPEERRVAEDFQKQLLALTRGPDGRPNKDIDIDQLDALMAKLIATQGHSVIGGVDWQALRQNLHVAKQMQELARTLEAETRQPRPDRAKMDRLVGEIQALQRGLRLDLMPQGMPPMPPTPPAAPPPPATGK